MSAALEELDNLTKGWSSALGAPNYAVLLQLLQFLDRQKFHEYLPTFGPHHSSYLERLLCWLENISGDEDRKTLFELAGEIVFFDLLDFTAMYRAALSGPITRWMLDITAVGTIDSETSSILSEHAETTWFCPVTDSMDIAGFFHANHMPSQSYRPDWRSLHEFSSAESVRNHLKAHGMTHVVLLEDIVGSGRQMQPAVALAEELCDEFDFLLVPLICCSGGVQTGRQVQERTRERIRFEPLMMTGRGAEVLAPEDGRQKELFRRVIDLAERVHNSVTGRPDSRMPYLGFGDSGALLVTYSNCPNNTLPMIHFASPNSSWQSLFPRVTRG